MTAMTIDETTFAAAVERHRRELHVHCYRMLGSFDEAEDALQDALVRARPARDGVRGGRARGSPRGECAPGFIRSPPTSASTPCDAPAGAPPSSPRSPRCRGS